MECGGQGFAGLWWLLIDGNAKGYERASLDFLVALQIQTSVSAPPVSPPRFPSGGVGAEREVGHVVGFPARGRRIDGRASKGAISLFVCAVLQEDEESGWVFFTRLIILSCPSYSLSTEVQADAEEARLLLLLPKKHICAPGMGGKKNT